ncbi:MAG: helix-turn-helix transcriptional regulator [Burkholderiaceae bacterium]|nr:helix-turn-helix transcriptional regulator [Burkholderiaceae bacterium]
MPARGNHQDDGQYLERLGARVRQRREALGLTRRRLAEESGVSERYLAQLELGSGNASVLLIRRLAQALEVAPEMILLDTPAGSATAQIFAVLRYLDPATLAQAAGLLEERFGKVSHARRQRVALIGLRGAGKSTLGTALARRLRIPFHELDLEVERDAGMSLANLFALYGQDAYRSHERNALEALAARDGHRVIATGGSLPTEPESFEFLRSHCFTVWLRAEPEDHMKRVVAAGDLRPIRGRTRAMAELETILAEREALYAQADLRVDTSVNSVRRCVELVLAAIGDGALVSHQPRRRRRPAQG